MDLWVIWLIVAVVLRRRRDRVDCRFFLAPFAVGASWRRSSTSPARRHVVSVVVFLVASTLALFAFVRPIARRHLAHAAADRAPAPMR